MILDPAIDSRRCSFYEVFDLDTGRWLPGDRLTYADDETGVYRILLTDEDGHPYPDSDNSGALARAERRGRIKIVLKPEYASEEEAFALRRVEDARVRHAIEAQREALSIACEVIK